MKQGLKIMLAAGEASGDLHGASLVRELKKKGAFVFGLGGSRMQDAGMRLDLDLASHAVIGFVEVIKNFGFFYSAMQQAVELLKKEQPDVLVIIDNPGFNLRLAQRAKAMGIKVCGYISPQIWAWKKNRIHQLKRDLSRMLVTFPFEKEIYDRVGLDCRFVGNPLMDSVKPSQSALTVRRGLGLKKDQRMVGLLPGSRKQEVRWLLPVMLQSAALLLEKDPDIIFVLVMASGPGKKAYAAAKESNLPIVYVEPGHTDTYSIRASFNAAMVSSGTATLETAIMGTPLALLYRVHAWEYAIGRWLVDLPYIGLPNVVAGKKIIPEFIQGGLKPMKIAAAIWALLSDKAYQSRQKSDLKAAVKKLGKDGVAPRTAAAILDLVK